MSVKQQISDDVKSAMRARESSRLATLRLLTAAIKQREVDERTELDEVQVLATIEKMIKQRRDSISQFDKGGRPDLVEIEQAEIEILKVYMPAALSEAEIQTAVIAAIAETGAAGAQDMGKVMGLLKQRLAGRADMTVVSGQVKAALVQS